MLKTKFGTRLFSLLLVLVCVFALVGCTGGATDPSGEAIADATAKAQEIQAQLIWDKTAMSQVTSNVKGFITKTKYANVTVEWESSEPDVLDIEGNVIYLNSCHLLRIPSIAPASYISRLTFCKPEMLARKETPILCHNCTTIIIGIIYVGSLNQVIGSVITPIDISILFT